MTTVPAPTNKVRPVNRLLGPVTPVVAAARHLLWYLRYHASMGDQRSNR